MFPISDFPCLKVEDLKTLGSVLFDPYVEPIDCSVFRSYWDPSYVASQPKITVGFPAWFNQLIEYADYIDPILSRRFINA